MSWEICQANLSVVGVAIAGIGIDSPEFPRQLYIVLRVQLNFETDGYGLQ